MGGALAATTSCLRRTMWGYDALPAHVTAWRYRRPHGRTEGRQACAARRTRTKKAAGAGEKVLGCERAARPDEGGTVHR